LQKQFTALTIDPTAFGWLKVRRYAEYRSRMNAFLSFPYMAIGWRLVILE
jgi:hypothetical protein